jgi:hypothetical protein
VSAPSNPSDSDSIWLTLSISPEPTGDEGEALIAAISAYLAVQPVGTPAAGRVAEVDPWASAGRRAAVRGRTGAPPMGWGRARTGWG